MLKRFFGSDTEPERTEQVEASLEKTRSSWRDRLASVFGPVDITEETWEGLEERLIQADVGAVTAMSIVEDTRALARDAGVRRADELWRALRHVMEKELEKSVPDGNGRPAPGEERPTVILMVGVNGTGKTTTIAKLARGFTQSGQRVALVAADTFRAAAIDQLQTWGERVGVPVLASQPGADPAAVTFDALSSKAAQMADVILVDTAGRLHTQRNLMQELEKINRVCGRVVPGAPHQTLLVLDATTGQNGLVQAKEFTKAVGLTGIVLAKLDSSAKGGIAFAVQRELGVPILYVGTGEQTDDLAPFDPTAYVSGLLGRNGGL